MGIAERRSVGLITAPLSVVSPLNQPIQM